MSTPSPYPTHRSCDLKVDCRTWTELGLVESQMLKITVEERQSAEQKHTWQWKSFVEKRELAHAAFLEDGWVKIEELHFQQRWIEREIIYNH